MKIGRITRVDGIRISAIFFERLQPFLISNGAAVASPRINSYVKTNIGLDTIICQIVGEHEAEYDKQSNLSKSTQAAATGAFIVDLEVRGHITDGEFKSGLRCLPIVGASIETLPGSELAILYSAHGSKPMKIGNSLFDETNAVFMDAGKLLASHIGIFGNTGSGKSNTLACILRKYMHLLPKNNGVSRVIVFDLNNEYGGDAILDQEQKTIYHLNTRQKVGTNRARIPLNLYELDEDSWGTILRATQKTQMPVVRRAYRRWKNGNTVELIEELKQVIADRRTVFFYTFRNYCDSEVDGIESIAWHSKSNCFYYPGNAQAGYEDFFVDTEEDVKEIRFINDPGKLQQFYYWLVLEASRSAESGLNFDFIQPLLPRAKSVIKDLEKLFDDKTDEDIGSLFDEKNLTIIQLGDVNSGSREMLPSLLAELVMKDAALKKGDGVPQQITTLVVDEAHNLLSYDTEQSDLVHDNTLRVFEKVIKEGRKFGVFLCLASQRPSDISSTITSQIHNYFIHKLVNPNDIERIRKTVSFMGETSLSMLSALGQGECIISGPSLYMPQYVCIEQLEKKFQPNSSDLRLFGEDGLFNNDEKNDQE